MLPCFLSQKHFFVKISRTVVEKQRYGYVGYLWNSPIRLQRKKAPTFAATMVEPTGVPARIEISIPVTAQITDRITEKIVTDLKLLKMRMEDIAGKITRAEIIKEPTRFIAMTITTATMTAMSRL